MESLDGSHCEEHSTELEQNPETDGTVIGRNTRRYYGAGRYSATERTAESIGTGTASSIPPGTVAFLLKVLLSAIHSADCQRTWHDGTGCGRKTLSLEKEITEFVRRGYGMKQRVEENGFDSWLESSVPEILPDEIVKQVTPWKKAMGQVLTGFVMTSLSLDIFYLDKILPAVGYLFFFWGFSAVFRENRWFRICGGIAAARGLFFQVKLWLPAEVFLELIYTKTVFLFAAGFYTYGVFVFLLFFWLGLRTVQQKAGLPPHAKGVLVLMLWYLVFYLLRMFFGYLGLLLPVALFVVYAFAVQSVAKIMKELEDAGYVMDIAPTRIHRLISGICILGLFFAAALL